MRPDASVRLYGYRWVVLAAFCLVNLTMQTLWIAYAPITAAAAKFYGVGDLAIGFLAMSFMIAFIPLSIPASWLIDTHGFRFAVGLGAVMMGVFGMIRGLAGTSYPVVLVGTLGVAAAQPLFLNAWTKLPAQWFPIEERASAVGVITLANLLGTGVGMALTPVLIETMSIARVQLVYGVAAAASSVFFLAVARERPPTPPSVAGAEVRALVKDGLRHALGIKAFWAYLLVAFLGMGIFNGVTTWIEGIVRPRGFSATQAGTLGAVMLLGSLVGAVSIPPISDRMRLRRPFLVLGNVLAIPGLLGLAFARSYPTLLASGFVLGFFLVSTLPIGMQYAAEITHPTPEGTSAGLIQLSGQGAVIFVYVMEAMRTSDGSFTPSLVFAIGMMLFAAALSTQLRERADVAVKA